MISSASRHFGVWLQLAVRDSIIIGVSAGCVFLLAVAFIGSLIYRPVELKSTGKGSPYSIAERRVPELIPVLGSQPAGDVNHKPGGRLPLLFARPAVTLATLKRAATNFAAW